MNERNSLAIARLLHFIADTEKSRVVIAGVAERAV
jgi:hypothetical protein